MKTQNNNGGLKNKRTELPPPPPPAKRLGQERRERDMLFWLKLTPEVRATYMSTAYHPAHHEGQILRKAVELAKMAEMPSVNQF